MIRANVLFLLVVFAVGGLGCGGAPTVIPTSPSSAPSQVWILHPHEGDHLTVYHAVTIQLQGASFSGLDRFQVKVSEAGLEWKAFPQSTGSGGAQYGTLFFAETSWTPTAIGDFSIAVRAINASGTSPWDTVHITVVEPVMKVTHTPSPTPILGSHSGLELKATLTPTPASWQAAAIKNANCRAGPGTAYNERGFVPKGETVEIVGRNEAGTWLNVTNPNGKGQCWVSIVAFDIQFDLNPLPVAAVPTPPATPNQGGIEEVKPKGCTVTNAATGQTSCVAPCPAGAVPGEACKP